jgi:hypothetical protein
MSYLQSNPQVISNRGMARPFTEALRRILITKGKGDIVAGAAQLIRVIHAKALRGDAWALQTLLERVEGKPVQVSEVSVSATVQLLPDADLMEVIEGEHTVLHRSKGKRLLTSAAPPSKDPPPA